jgi:gluconolactonase
MWNLDFTPPTVIEARVLTRLPDNLRKPRRTEWCDANKPGQEIDSFLEGPVFDRSGNLFVADVPYGRIFRVTPALEWKLLTQYDGWPNGLAIHKDGTIWIADYRRGLMRIDPDEASAVPSIALGHRNSESFKGLNDLTFDKHGSCYFTDQGQTGLQDPTGRVFRFTPATKPGQGAGRLDCLLANAPSPNGIALDASGKGLFVAVTRANAVWRAPLLPDGSITKMGAFRTFFGASGPDGMAVDAEGRLVVAHASLGGAFVINPFGEVTHFIKSPAGSTVTNVAFRPRTSTVVLTESETGTLLEADLIAPGALLFSHQ